MSASQLQVSLLRNFDSPFHISSHLLLHTSLQFPQYFSFFNFISHFYSYSYSSVLFSSFFCSIVASLEILNPTENPAQESEGSWDLIFTNTNIFRSSPLFMAARAMAKAEQSANFNNFSDLFMSSLRFARIGRVTQTITATTVQSEFETEVPIISGAITGTIVSTAEIEESDSTSMTLLTDKVRIKEGSSNIPVFSQLMDNFPGVSVKSIGGLLENIPQYENPQTRFQHILCG